MKNLFVILILSFLSSALEGQLKEPLSYQVTVRNTAGEIMASKIVYFRLSILMGEDPGVTVYSELHTAETDSMGTVTLLIGEGNDRKGDFNAIKWDIDKFFLKVEIDFGRGSPFLEILNTQLLTVPSSSPSEETPRKDFIIEEDELTIVRKYAGTFLEYRHTGPSTHGGPNIIWIKTSMENVFGKISALGRTCDFIPGDNLYLTRTLFSPGGVSGYWEYYIENNSSVSYRLTELQHDRKVLVETLF